MDERRELHMLMARLEDNNRQQLTYTKILCILTGTAALCCLISLVVLLCFVPKINGVMDRVEVILADAEKFTQALAQSDIKSLISNLEDVARQLSKVDFAQMSRDISALVQSTQTGIQEALSKLRSLDLDTLNRAIADFAAIIEPLAKFFGK